jgi:ERCC4-type nuclease
MILVDPRIGSAEVQPLLEAQRLKTTIQHLEFGDFAFSGNGPEGPIMIGIERKRVRDLLSSLRTGRFAGHQLPGLLKIYDWCYLFVEAILRANPESGVLEEGGHHSWVPVRLGESGFTYRDLENHLTTLECRAGACFRVRRTSSIESTASSVGNLWHYWNDKEWDEHRSHLSLNLTSEYGWIVKPGLLRRVAAQLTSIGWEKSGAISHRFGSVREMANAEEKDWLEIPGVGKKLSRRIVAALKGEINEEDRSANQNQGTA